MKRSVILTVFSLLVLGQFGWGQVPQTISYQGVLRDASGNIVDNGTYTLRFKLYNVEVGGSALGTPEWSEDLSAIVTKGVFSVILGSSTTFSSSGIFFTELYWLETIIEAGPGVTAPEILSPRIELTAVPYAIKARGVTGSANIFRGSGNVGIGTTAPLGPLHVEIPATGDVIVAKRTDTGQQLKSWFHQPSGQTAIQSLNSTGSGTDLLLNPDGGNVGIGITTPAFKLEVAGDASVLGNLDVQGTITQGSQTKYYSFGVRDANSTEDENYLKAYVLATFGYPINTTIPIHLPQGATITDITIHVNDNDINNDANCSLYALVGASFTQTEVPMTPIDAVSSTGTGKQSPTTTLSTPHTVDNQTNIYWLRIYAGTGTVVGPTILFYGGYITYTVN